MIESNVVANVDALYARILALPAGPPVPWLLDVDGVLNIESPDPDGLDDWPTYRHALVATSKDPAVPFRWSPELVDCINLLVDRGHAQVWWLTSWNLDAPLCAAPAIGLMAGRRVSEEDQPPGTQWWKLEAVQKFAAAGDFVIWTDDYIDDAGVAADLTGGHVLALCPDPGRGLSPQHLHLIVDTIGERRAMSE